MLFDAGELPDIMEPLSIGESSKHRAELTEMAFELAQKSAKLDASIPVNIQVPLVRLVRSMNCYYSNLIEGHDTHPVDIERALRRDFSANANQRNLQLEAKSHIKTQEWIDNGGLDGFNSIKEKICEIHKVFCEDLPEELLRVKKPNSDEYIDVIAGEIRKNYVEVGNHLAVSPGSVEKFLDRFESGYKTSHKHAMIINSACIHHRLLWVHPFIDGNGRVARLLSYAMLRNALQANGIWSIARGLARNVDLYKSKLASADLRKRNDLDGRGTLSEETLADFCKFFIETCIDQVDFMSSLVKADNLNERILSYIRKKIEEKHLPAKSELVIRELLFKESIERKYIPLLTNEGERNSRRITSALSDENLIISDSSKAPWRLNFPATVAPIWFPDLFPEKTR